ncbi:thiol:disulfide interchange protein DsbA [Massilia terrae]|uniref:Thiol:disulfide interchange protein DsbA n=1 Tax=Massilia terrae TaxID=1811224 RepID=A0ABT2D3N0_9BURK|nr:thiol:disulfide interchange protein DsbA/DsbL [Massilia terrae]MCS0660858.1 thiol:disulfide interchange protein DsbA/DsbL [Massilia terrae]
MRPLRRLACAAALLCLSTPLLASPASPKAGVEYLVMNPPQPTDSGKKIEVTEFFAYYCPHCYAFEPLLAAWVKKQGASIVFKRVHIARDESVMPQQRMFYTLDALGLVDQYHDKVFAAMHQQRLPLDTDEKVFDWAAAAGLPRARFIDTYRSFGVQARMDQAIRKMELYGISQWPMIAIDGRYLTSPYHAHLGSNKDVTETEQQQEALQVMDFLVSKAKADKR